MFFKTVSVPSIFFHQLKTKISWIIMENRKIFMMYIHIFYLVYSGFQINAKANIIANKCDLES